MGIIHGEQKLNRIKFDLEKVIIVPFGDNHFGSKYCDKDLLKRHIEWLLKSKDTYAIFMGDNIECATRDSVGAGVYEQEEIIDKQIEDWISLVNPLAKENKILGIHTGNHEWRVFNSSGIDLTKLMAKQLDVKYFGWTIFHSILVGNNSYEMMTVHGHSGNRLPHTKIKAVIDYANMADAEIYCMGHLHQLSHHTRMFYRINKKNKLVEEGEKHFILCGSYLNHWGSYAERTGYEMMKKGSPKIKLGGLERTIRVSL